MCKYLKNIIVYFFILSTLFFCFFNTALAKRKKFPGNYSVEKYVITQGITDKKAVALTFDCGSGKGDFERIIDFLIKQNIPATFFVTGLWIKNFPEDAKKLSNPLFSLGNHSYSHLHMRNLSEQKIISELNNTESLALRIIGKTTKPFFRPPYGEYNYRLVNIMKNAGFTTVTWTIDTIDWMPQTNVEKIKNRIFKKLQNGAIILMHVDTKSTFSALPQVVNILKNKAYSFSSLAEITNKKTEISKDKVIINLQ